MNFLVFPHLGLGDQIIMSGFIHYILENHDPNKILIIAYDNYQKKTLEHLYSDTPKVSFHYIEHPNGRFSPFINSLNGRPFQSPIEMKGEIFYLLNFGLHSQYMCSSLPNHSWADSFYLQGNLDPSYRFSYFKLPKNMEESDILFDKITKKVGEKYVLIHDEPKTNRVINYHIIRHQLKETNCHTLPILYLGLERYNYPLIDGLMNIDVSKELECTSLLAFWKLIQNATACHFMDSSIGCMTDLIKDCKAKLNVYMPNPRSTNEEPIHLVKNNWSVWYKEDVPVNHAI